ncbi:hypothetical protein FMM05_05165 [Flavobacterium zepuense]|uniref:Uncharacterized protein n=1 Tax=Flavobacterium zepuense TaxID=2593302 RepID=A0A552V8I0_9FLAO|nr:hypothetical protein [Flavobacterium zepuense]TRW26768.1 hypothetical protein FMM05_05165 [Flavobacterium zepuense]
MEIDGTAAACFNKEEVKFLVNSHFTNKNKLSKVLFLGTEVSGKNCIGLYTYCFTARTMSTRIIHKVLKFEDKLYLVDGDNKTGDSLALKEFLDKYATLFSKDEIKRLTDSFNAGTKFNGSFL